jgi:hypothetical protein
VCCKQGAAAYCCANSVSRFFFVYLTYVVIFLEEQGKCGLLQLRFCPENCCVEDGFSAALVCVVGMKIPAIIVLEVRFLPVEGKEFTHLRVPYNGSMMPVVFACFIL